MAPITVTLSMERLDLSKATDPNPVKGRHVWKLKVLLNAWAVANGEKPPLTLSDRAGDDTKRLLQRFQSAVGTQADATVGPVTWRLLVEFDIR